MIAVCGLIPVKFWVWKKVNWKVKKRLLRNPRRNTNRMTKETKISDRSIRNILKNKLQRSLMSFKILIISHGSRNKLDIRERKSCFACPNIVFSDEKIFQFEKFLNSQNDILYFTDRSYMIFSYRLATRRQHSPQIMVWPAVTADWRSTIVFIQPGVKERATIYR